MQWYWLKEKIRVNYAQMNIKCDLWPWNSELTVKIHLCQLLSALISVWRNCTVLFSLSISLTVYIHTHKQWQQQTRSTWKIHWQQTEYSFCIYALSVHWCGPWELVGGMSEVLLQKSLQHTTKTSVHTSLLNNNTFNLAASSWKIKQMIQ